MNQRVDRALADGLALRPLTQTIVDTRSWSSTMPPADVADESIAGMTRATKADLLAAHREGKRDSSTV